jgi:glucose-6-phosphate 1-dehydrogenase
VVQFREPPHSLFAQNVRRTPEANRLVIQVQPAEGIQLQLQTKVPDEGMRTRLTDLDFQFDREYSDRLPDAYQRLLLDAAAGDASLFARSDEVELAWQIVDPILEAWNSPAAPPLEFYLLGQWGPPMASQWMQEQGRSWFDVCPVLH